MYACTRIFCFVSDFKTVFLRIRTYDATRGSLDGSLDLRNNAISWGSHGWSLNCGNSLYILHVFAVPLRRMLLSMWTLKFRFQLEHFSDVTLFSIVIKMRRKIRRIQYWNELYTAVNKILVCLKHKLDIVKVYFVLTLLIFLFSCYLIECATNILYYCFRGCAWLSQEARTAGGTSQYTKILQGL